MDYGFFSNPDASDGDDPYNLGDVVLYDDKEYIITKKYGRDFNGTYEYMISSKNAKVTISHMVSEYVIKKSKDSPPEIPGNCKHVDVYFNVISNNLKFWVCKSCKAELVSDKIRVKK